MEKTIKITLHKGQKPTPAQLDRLAMLKNRPIALDDDAPEYTMEEFEEMRRAAAEKRAAQKKEVVTLRLSPSTVQKAKSVGKGYTSFLSRLIENAINDKDIVSRSL